MDDAQVCGGENRANPDSWDDPEIDELATADPPDFGEPWSTRRPWRARLRTLGALLPIRRRLLVNDLARTLTIAGLNVIADPGATTHNHGQLTAVRGLLVHHTGSSSASAWTVVRDGRSDLPGPLAQLTLERDGTVRVISTGVSWHAGTGTWPSIGTNVGNAYCLGVEVVYNGYDITAAQRRVLPKLCATIAQHYSIPVGNIIGHREWATPAGRKWDPGQVDMDVLRRATADVIGGVPPTDESRPLLTEGVTSALVWQLQGWLNRMFSYSSIDRGPGPTSRYGPQTMSVISEFQRRVNAAAGHQVLTVDGKVGPATWGQLERYGFNP
jgi:peptidoglycan hydrolase-like protein with peptidoglycan-binding domain